MVYTVNSVLPELSEKLLEALNKQVVNELYSAYLYLSMAAYLDAKGLPGFATWMKAQAKEELEHAMKFYEYINDRGGRVRLDAIPKPPQDWVSITDLFKQALQHEKSVTASIYRLAEIAEEEKDRATQVFLQWFIDEQVEEEKTFMEILGKLKLAGEVPQALLMLDAKLGERK